MLSRMYKSTLVRYTIVGLINTAISYICYYICIKIGIIYYIAGIIAQIIGGINGYIWNKIFTFDVRGNTKKTFAKFAIVQASQYVLGVSLNTIMIYGFGLSPELSGFVVLFPCMAFSYAGNRYWSFKKNSTEER